MAGIFDTPEAFTHLATRHDLFRATIVGSGSFPKRH
jgi:hypothetical protein